MKSVFILALSIGIGVCSEALRYAKHGCEVQKSKKACKIYKRLSDPNRLKKKRGPSSQTQRTIPIQVESSYQETNRGTTFKSKVVDKDLGLKAKFSIAYDKKTMDGLKKACGAYGEHLKKCQAFKCKYKHPFTNQFVEKRIMGKVGDNCKTEEEMPNNGLLTCQIPPDKIIFFAEYADTLGRKHIDKVGKWMNNEVCAISGY